jgi:hypothetical protein
MFTSVRKADQTRSERGDFGICAVLILPRRLAGKVSLVVRLSGAMLQTVDTWDKKKFQESRKKSKNKG